MKAFVILSLLILPVYSLLHKCIYVNCFSRRSLYFSRVQSPLELKKEQCENNLPCDQLSEWVGFYQAYQKYFGPV
ncbi:hypothetical protein XELAEV_18023876mg [Xenopus laevis]|uniref:Gla domain-containing protein n=1 Tax=Xenopus laevis TaxID=8355 RepID=A0A974D6V5_XENLA|nr:hypothetical protein XELAEV_18023876mg [Xenopus laevis]